MDVNFFIDESMEGWQNIICNIPKPGKNHDGWAYKNSSAVVSDGATPLDKTWGDDLLFWVTTLSGLMCENSKDANVSLTEAWSEAVQFNNTLFQPKGIHRTMGSAHLRFSEQKIDGLIIGDVKVLTHNSDGTYTEFFDNRLDILEQKADALINKGVIEPAAARWHNRMKANTVDGYHVLSDDPTIGFKALPVMLDKDALNSIIIATDGFWRLFDTPQEAFAATDSDDVMDVHTNLTQAGDIVDDLTFMRLNKTV